MAADGASFAELEQDFLRIVRETVFCTVTTVGDDGRPHNRMLHPVFVVRGGRPLGWALTGRTWGAEGLAGYGPDAWRNPIFTPLRLEPWRVQVMRGQEYPLGNLTGAVWYGP